MIVTLPNGLPCGVATHALERFVERVRPGLDPTGRRAGAELVALVEQGEWINGLEELAPEHRWLKRCGPEWTGVVLVGDIAFVVVPSTNGNGRCGLALVTVVDRTSLSPLERERRTKLHRTRRRRVRAKARKSGGTHHSRMIDRRERE